ncbi:MAG TPA: hypothetical protein VJA20_01180 [Candidatus Nanoarchaeia archaeon]|nr:hypothetical protein [Candidatus Nanoarchaeia archaeon]
MDGWMVCCILDSSDVSSNQEGEGDFIIRWMQYVVQEERARKGSDGWIIEEVGQEREKEKEKEKEKKIRRKKMCV